MARLPLVIDFGEWLLDREGISVPGATITILTTEWEDRRHVCKPDVEWPGRVEYRLGDNATEDRNAFLDLLLNLLKPEIVARKLADRSDFIKAYGSRQWLYNRVSWAELGAMERIKNVSE